MKKYLSVLLAFIMAFSCMSCLSVLSIAASESDGIFNFFLNSAGTEYAVSGRDSNASGDISIPSVFNGKPVTSVCQNAFCGYDALKSITIPGSVTSIGNEAFASCDTLSVINVASDNPVYTSVDGVLFNKSKTMLIGVPGAKSGNYTIPDNVTSIGGFAFYGCNSLSGLTIPNSITSVGESAFEYCHSIKSVNISDLAAWCKIEFNNTESNPLRFAHNLYLNDNPVTNLDLPNTVTSVGNYAFYYCSSLSSVTIPSSVTNIGKYAFSECSSLSGVTIPNSVTSIGEDAFYDCTSLSSVTIPNSVVSIGGGAFAACTSLSSITIPNSVTSIGGGAFYGCTSLRGIQLSNGLTSIGDSTFNGCTALDSITIPNGVTSISESALSGCTALNSITIPNGVTSIGESALSGCAALSSIVIPDSVTNIGEYAFAGCTGISSITIPTSVTSIGEFAFKCCTKLNAINVSSGNKAYSSADGVLFNKAKKRLLCFPCGKSGGYTIPNSVTNINDGAFFNCVLLSSVMFPNSVTGIGIWAFYNCAALTSVQIGSGLTYIGDHAFYNCKMLKNITIPANVVYIERAAIGYWNLFDYPVALSGFTITCVKGSAAETYAIQNRFNYISTAASLATPSLLLIQNTSSGVGITWNKITDAEGYVVYRRSGSSGWEKIATIANGSTVSYTDTSVKSGTTYTYTVRAYAGFVRSSYNKAGLSIKYLAMPALESIANTSSGVTVKWAASAGAAGYIVYRKTADGWKALATLKNGKAVSYTDTSVKSGTTYTYTVRAYSGSVRSSYNKAGLSMMFLALPALESIANTSSGVTVKWAASAGAAGYKVYRKTVGGWAVIATINSGKVVSYTDTNVAGGTNYTYTVKAFGDETVSAYCKGLSIKALSVPKLSSATSAKAGITVIWEKVTGAEGYIVYRKTGSGSWVRLAVVKDGAKVSYLDRTAKKGTTYTYTVKAYSGSFVSSYVAKGVSCKDIIY